MNENAEKYIRQQVLGVSAILAMMSFVIISRAPIPIGLAWATMILGLGMVAFEVIMMTGIVVKKGK